MPEQFYDPRTYKARDSVGYYIRRLQSTLTTRIEASFATHEFTLLQWILIPLTLADLSSKRLA